jgi:Mu DNA-binding domain
MQEWFSAKELIGLPGMPTTIRGIRITAQRKNWPYEQKGHSGPGRKENLYALAVLPAETQAYLTSIYKEKNGSPEPDRDDRTGNPSHDRLDPSPIHAVALVEHTELVGQQVAQPPEPAVAPTQREPRAVGRPKGSKGEAKIDAWVEIFKARKAWCATQGIAKQVDCDGAFSEAYLRHEIDLPEEVYETVTRISRSTIARKRSENEHGGVTALAGKEGAGRPK